MPETDAIQVLLAGRSGVYRLLQNILGNEPTTEMLDQLCSDGTCEVFQLFGDEQTEYGKAVKSLILKANECKANGEKALYDLEAGFARLFVGPNPPEAAPWESFFLAGDGSLFHKTTLDVRNVYRVHGLLPASYPNVADDHIAIELDYMAQLAQRAENALTEGDTTAALEALEASDEFLREHLAKWVSLFTASIRKSKYSDFYLEAAVVLENFLPIDLSALIELRSALNR